MGIVLGSIALPTPERVDSPTLAEQLNLKKQIAGNRIRKPRWCAKTSILLANQRRFRHKLKAKRSIP
jgi:hypothetical protein